MSVPLNLVALLLVLLVINWMTFTGVWWVQWAALGLGIAWAITMYRVLMIRFVFAKAAWWMKWLVIVFVVAWVVSFVRAVEAVFRP